MSRSIFRHMLLGAALTVPLLVAGCAEEEGVPQSFPPLRYNYLAPISLNVASIQTRLGYAQAQDGTPLDAMSPETPLQGVQQMLQDRLVAGGAGGTAIITINSASINQVNDTAVGNISLRLTVVSADGRARGYTDASVSRTRTMPDDTSEDALRAFLYSMTQDLVNAENVELDTRSARTFRNGLSAADRPRSADRRGRPRCRPSLWAAPARLRRAPRCRARSSPEHPSRSARLRPPCRPPCPAWQCLRRFRPTMRRRIRCRAAISACRRAIRCRPARTSRPRRRVPRCPALSRAHPCP